MGWAHAEGSSGPEPTCARAGTQTNGGASHGAPYRPPPPPTPSLLRPGLPVVVIAAGLAPLGSPPGSGTEPGPSMRQEGVYTPTAHRGAPRRGDGCGPLLARLPRLGGGRGPQSCLGRSRDGMGPSHRGTAAVARAGRSRARVRAHTTPPPPSATTDGDQGPDR